MRHLVFGLLALIVSFAFAGAAMAPASAPVSTISLSDMMNLLQDAPIIPAEWAGIWQVESQPTDCDDVPFGAPNQSTDTLCTGASAFQGDPSVQYTCSGTVGPTSINITCESTDTLFLDCLQTTTIVFQATRTNDTYTGSSEITSFATGTGVGCSSVPPSCFRSTSTGTRIDSEPSPCTVATEPESWGKIKSLYTE